MGEQRSSFLYPLPHGGDGLGEGECNLFFASSEILGSLEAIAKLIFSAILNGVKDLNLLKIRDSSLCSE
jgi:hypothetical protein